MNGIPTFDLNVGPVFALHCTTCHNHSAPTAGLDLTTYTTALKGATDGPVIVPGDVAGSRLITVQSAKHFANLSPEELALVQQWISTGGKEK